MAVHRCCTSILYFVHLYLRLALRAQSIKSKLLTSSSPYELYACPEHLVSSSLAHLQVVYPASAFLPPPRSSSSSTRPGRHLIRDARPPCLSKKQMLLVRSLSLLFVCVVWGLFCVVLAKSVVDIWFFLSLHKTMGLKSTCGTIGVIKPIVRPQLENAKHANNTSESGGVVGSHLTETHFVRVLLA